MSEAAEPTWPRRLDLARTPTPLERLDRWSDRLGYELWVKRDDLTGTVITGNKIRKLEFLLAAAVDRGADTVITCGGVNSNHARATAVASVRLGLRPHLLLRGEDRRPATGNLLLDRWMGAHIELVTPEDWERVDDLMAQRAADHEGAGRRAYVIPEGGSNGLGCLGYARAAAELLEDAVAAGVRVGRIVHALGSGGTTAGLALGLATAEASAVENLAVCVTRDAAWFDPRIHRVIDDAVQRGYFTWREAHRARWRVVEGYAGRGYAETTEAELQAHRELARVEGLVVDPVYTGKAFRALADLGPPTDGVTVFLHTGGIFELFAYADAIDALPPD